MDNFSSSRIIPIQKVNYVNHNIDLDIELCIVFGTLQADKWFTIYVAMTVAMIADYYYSRVVTL